MAEGRGGEREKRVKGSGRHGFQLQNEEVTGIKATARGIQSGDTATALYGDRGAPHSW